MGEEFQSWKVWCWTARSWARFIGWFYIVVSVLLLSGILLLLSGVIVSEENKASSIPESGNVVAAFLRDPVVEFVILIASMILAFAAGIVLVNGVSQGSSSKLKCWLIIIGISFALDMLESIVKIGSLNYEEIVGIFISIPMTLFSMWIVNVHRKELKRPFSRMGLSV